MANLFRASGTTTTLLPPTTWAAPNALFPTESRNDGSIYTWASATSTVTLPSSNLADGYLLVGMFKFDDTSNGRHNPQGRFIQTSGTGTFTSSSTSGYNRDASEFRSYVRCWAFVDNPSASATFQFQWQRGSDGPTGGTSSSAFEVIPLYYNDVAVYSSTSTAIPSGTTPTSITGFSGTDGTNITISSDTITVTGDNKRYLLLGSFYFTGFTNRTQRWGSFTIDGTFDNSCRAYAYARTGGNPVAGAMFSTMIETSTADRTIAMQGFLGAGTADNQGGAVDANITTASGGSHHIVVIELPDSAECIKTTGDATQNISSATAVDITIAPVSGVEFNDAASFTRNSDTEILINKTADLLTGATVGAASGSVTSGARFTGETALYRNGGNLAITGHGNYLRGSVTPSTFGYSNSLLNFSSGTINDTYGLRHTELSGTEGHTTVNIQPGWVGFWGLNLDTLQPSAPKPRRTFIIS